MVATHNEDDVKERFGPKNYQTIIDKCKSDEIQMYQLLEISKSLGLFGQLNRIKDDEIFKKDLGLFCRHMLSEWWRVAGGPGVQLSTFIGILEQEGLIGLATELSQNGGSQMATPFPLAAEVSKSEQENSGNSKTKILICQGNRTENCIQTAFKNKKWDWEDPSSNGIRKALLIGNTYELDSSPLKGCKKSTIEIQKALVTNLENNGKVPFECNTKSKRSVSQIEKDVQQICNEADSEEADVLLIYICGHGGHNPLELKKEGDVEEVENAKDCTKYLLNATDAIVSEGGNFIWGENGKKADGKLYKNQLIATICQLTPNVTHRIIIFDCCRGVLKAEEITMSGSPVATLNVKFSKLSDLSNRQYKNTFVIHSTLPHQVAWCEKDGPTKFSKYFHDFVGGDGGLVNISCLDEVINAAIKRNEPSGTGVGNHVQMVELTKWIDQPFSW